MAGVRLSGIAKRFAHKDIIKKIDLKIHDGEFLIVVGPSGCGKTTLLRIIAGLEAPSSGDIYINDCEVTHVEPDARDISMVFQDYALYPHMNVYDNISFGLRVRKTAQMEIHKKVQKVAGLLGLEEYLKAYPRELSGGQRQRVALGRAIVRQPQVFLMDEPLSNLDAKLRLKMRSELVKLHKKLRTTIIYVTHDQVEAMTMGSRIVVMNHGVLQQVGTPQELYDQPANIFVAGFLGTPPMNFIHGTVEGTPGKQCFHYGKQQVALPADIGVVPKKIVMGVRPECIKVDVQGLWCFIVDYIEALGAESLVYGTLADDTELVFRVSGRCELEAGQTVQLTFSSEKLRWFDSDSGLSLRLFKESEVMVHAN